MNLKPHSVMPEDLEEISKVNFQEGKKAIQNMQREVGKITTDKNEEVSRVKDHSEKLLAQIKKLKKDKKSLENKVQQLIEKEASNVGIQVDEKTTNTNRVNITTQEEDKLVEVKMYSEVGVPAAKDSSEDPKLTIQLS